MLKGPTVCQRKQYWYWLIFFSVDGIENSSSVSYELDKPYTSMRNGIEETTVCSRLNENLLIYNSKVPANGWNIGK